MGRTERRAAEKLKARNERDRIRLLNNIAEAQKNQKKLRDDAVDELEAMVTDANVSCIFAATACELKKRFKLGKNDIVDFLNSIDDAIGIIGTDTCPTIKDFKVLCALKTGINVCLTEEEAEEVERIYAEAEKNGDLVEDDEVS